MKFLSFISIIMFPLLANGAQLTYKYDDLNRLIKTDYVSQALFISHIFDQRHNRTQEIFGSSTAVITALADSYSIPMNSGIGVNHIKGLLANDFDPQGDSLTALLGDDVSHGVLILNANGSFLYTPTSNFVGEDTFTYSVTDGLNFSGFAVVHLHVRAGIDYATFGMDFLVWQVDSLSFHTIYR